MGSNSVITKKEADKIILAGDGTTIISTNLGISSAKAVISKGKVRIGEQEIPLKAFSKVKDKTCYLIEDNMLKPVAVFSDETNLYYKLVPTQDWPTIKLSSTPMHRHIALSPKKDTELKMKEISPVKGNVLDTCCGLGYTAIMASKSADEVVSFENDANVLFIAKYNPYSHELFNNAKIKLKNEDIAEGITKLGDEYFDRVVHDPPTFKYAPELYTKKFHEQLYRVMKKNGILYHYCPCPQKTKGRTFYPRMIRQLKEVGFRDVIYHDFSSGIRALR